MDLGKKYWNDWLDYRNAYNQSGIAKSIIDKLDINLKIKLLKEAIKNEQDGLVLDYILKIKEVDYEQYIDVVKGLYKYFLSIATYPGEYSPLGRQILTNLVDHDSSYRKKISDDCEKSLIEAEQDEDDEIVLLIGTLLYDIQSDRYKSFINLCKNSNYQSIRDVLEIFEVI